MIMIPCRHYSDDNTDADAYAHKRQYADADVNVDVYLLLRCKLD